MPLVKRAVEPASLCRNKIPDSVSSELECVTNNTLSGVILQLSSLSFHAENLFGELFSEASLFYNRASKLQIRIDILNDKVTKLDSTVEEVSLHDINMRKAFRPNAMTDQQVVSRESLSKTLQETYNRADKPPPLQDLNQYREDGRDALKIYTDPDYFFNLWREAMQKEMRDAKEKRREQRKRERKTNPAYRQERKVRAAVPKMRMKAKQMEKGAEFVDLKAAAVKNHVNEAKNQIVKKPSIREPPSTVPPPPSISDKLPPASNDNHIPTAQPPSPPLYDSSSLPLPDGLPEPPPPPLIEGKLPTNAPPPPPPPDISNVPPPTSVPDAFNAPPPPPPPPPPPVAVNAGSSSSPANQGGLAAQLAGVKLNKAEESDRPPPVVDSRSDLLSAIRVGINLKKVEQREKTASTTTGGNDVASILARRIAVEFSDSESDSYMSDDDEWDE